MIQAFSTVDLEIPPFPYLRMTQKSKYSKKAMQYAEWKRALALQTHFRFGHIPTFDKFKKITFIIAMPKSWSVKKKKLMACQPHRQTPDLSNLVKAFEDGLYPKTDSYIWKYQEIQKVWGAQNVPCGTIEVVYQNAIDEVTNETRLVDAAMNEVFDHVQKSIY